MVMMVKINRTHPRKVEKMIDLFSCCGALLWMIMVCTCLFTDAQVSLIALGPLTNLALAVRLDPSLPQKLKDLYVMGGNMEGKKTICSIKTGHPE